MNVGTVFYMEESSLMRLSDVGPPIKLPPGRLAPALPAGAEPDAVSAMNTGEIVA